MHYLLDTHAIIWYVWSDPRLPLKVRVMMDSEECFYSIASLWEIAIKASLKKEEKRLNLQRSIAEIAAMCDAQGIGILPITPQACERICTLPHIHDDPFDRMIIVQAILGGMKLVTKDANIHKYSNIEIVMVIGQALSPLRRGFHFLFFIICPLLHILLPKTRKERTHESI